MRTINNEETECQIRIEKLKARLREISGGTVEVGHGPGCSPAQLEQFLQRVIDYEEGPLDTDFNRLIEDGFELPPPEKLDDVQLTDKLWQVINGLARRSVFLENTDHLDDRQLYEQLWHHSLRERSVHVHPQANGCTRIDLVGTGSDEQIKLFLKHYADPTYRDQWQLRFGRASLPAHVDPPYDRDRHLPRPRW